MLLKRVSVQNVRSFFEKAELTLDGPLSIIIGPNGGGKTNLLDTIVIFLRRYLMTSMYAQHQPTAEDPNRHIFAYNDVLNNMILDKYTGMQAAPQIIEVDVAVSQIDIESMKLMKRDFQKLTEIAKKKYHNINFANFKTWNVDAFNPGDVIRYKFQDGNLVTLDGEKGIHYLQFLQSFEIDKRLRDEYGLAPLTTPLVYLPINRAANGFQSNIALGGYNEYEMKRHIDGANSRSGTQIVAMAVGRIAKKYRLLLEEDSGKALEKFRADESLIRLTEILKELGYNWSLETVNALNNQYDIRLEKQGTSFLVNAASSGEKELLTYLFAIFPLNVRDALIMVDEPELHLHPKWQKILLKLFSQLAAETGNQFLFSTHSPTFVSPESIQYVSRVYSENQKSRISRLNAKNLPDSKHLLNIVNSQNNERLLFADHVILVEGLSDRIFFEKYFRDAVGSDVTGKVYEVISVGGKGLFRAYEKLLSACSIECSIIADLDYIEQIGTQQLKQLFKPNHKEIKRDVIENIKSTDGKALVESIDRAIQTGNWDHAASTWDYIKNNRITLKPNLAEKEKAELKTFIADKFKENIFILSLGALEDYLPEGNKSKDIEKLIELLENPNYKSMLSEAGKPELEKLTNQIFIKITYNKASEVK